METTIQETQPTARTILVEVDVQNDFITGSLAVENGESVIEPLNKTAEVVRATNGTVVLTRDWHPKETSHFDTYGGPWPVHCVAETSGAAFAPTLEVAATDIILSKGTGTTDGYSGWEGRGDQGETLEALIAPRAPQERVNVLLGGLATDYCVKATGLDIADFFKDDERVRIYLLRDAVRAVALQAADEAHALKALKDARIIAITSEQARAIMMEAY